MDRRRATQTVAVALAAGVLAITTSCSSEDLTSASAPGPVEFEGGTSVAAAASMVAREGDSVVFGLPTIHNNNQDTAAVPHHVALLGSIPTSSAALVDVRVIDKSLHPHAGVGAARWPFGRYESLSEPLEGYTLTAEADADLLVIIEVRTTGDFYWPGATLDYELEGRTYRAATSLGVQVCPPTVDDCLPPWYR